MSETRVIESTSQDQELDDAARKADIRKARLLAAKERRKKDLANKHATSQVTVASSAPISTQERTSIAPVASRPTITKTDVDDVYKSGLNAVGKYLVESIRAISDSTMSTVSKQSSSTEALEKKIDSLIASVSESTDNIMDCIDDLNVKFESLSKKIDAITIKDVAKEEPKTEEVQPLTDNEKPTEEQEKAEDEVVENDEQTEVDNSEVVAEEVTIQQ